MTGFEYPHHLKMPKYLGQVIKEERKSRKMTQAELAAWTATSAKFISDVERGKETVQLDKVFDLIQALDLKLYISNELL